VIPSSASVSTSHKIHGADEAFLPLTTEEPPSSGYTKHPHVLGGVIACGYCRDMGLSFVDSVMSQYTITADGKRRSAGAARIPAIKCWGGYRKAGDKKRHPIFTLAEHRIASQWDEYIARIVKLPIDAKHLATWRSASSGATEIAQADQMEAAIRERRALIVSKLRRNADEAVLRQIRAALRDLDADDRKLQAMKKDAALRPALVDETTLRNILRRYDSVYESADAKTKNGLNRALVAALGSMPSVKRLGELGKHPGITKGADVIFRWPEVETILEAART
jgi:hypothetical protein